LRPRLPEKEVELCLDLFDKQEAKKRILKYIEDVFDDAERQFKNCYIHGAGRSVSVEIEDRDIATIEALHDLLLDAHGYSLDFIRLKRARELTAKMNKAFDQYYVQH